MAGLLRGRERQNGQRGTQSKVWLNRAMANRFKNYPACMCIKTKTRSEKNCTKRMFWRMLEPLPVISVLTNAFRISEKGERLSPFCWPKFKYVIQSTWISPTCLCLPISLGQ